jgi:hypothetical protein
MPLRETLQRAVRSARHAAVRRSFTSSTEYWESRYARGGDSGLGSYGALSFYKAEVLNGFVRDHDVHSVIEFGVGDGNQLALAHYPRYVGLDVSPTAIGMCKARFAGDATKSFFLYSTFHFVDNHDVFLADLALSLDVLFHLIEDAIFEAHLYHLFASAERFVIVYSSNSALEDGAAHVRHRNFTEWVEEHIEGWVLSRKIENPIRINTRADFYIYERSLSVGE